MAKKIIPASEVKVGDTIRNTFVMADMTIRREGVVAHTGPHGTDLRTGFKYSLGPASGTIQLLSRPEPLKPVIVLPTGEGALISYKCYNDTWLGSLVGDHWVFRLRNTVSARQTFSKTPEAAVKMLKAAHRTDFTVLFGGFAK